MTLVQFTVKDNNGTQRTLSLDQLGSALRQAVALPSTGTATLANVTGATSNQANAVAANTGRIGLIVVNESTATLFLKYGATASATSYTVEIAAGGYWEMPQPVYTGRIDMIWDAANGAARTTELVAD